MPENIQMILDSEKVTLHLADAVSEQHEVGRVTTSPCQVACPIDTRVKSYIGLIAAGEFDKAVEVVKRDNPFPGICGRVCIHPCETECERGNVDEPLAICSLKRFLADYEFKHGRKRIGKFQRRKNRQIAIVGAGPAGLTAANDLIRKGYGVTVFEASPEPGGMMIHGISPLNLPREIVRFEIDGIRELGVEIRTGMKIGEDISLAQLQADYQAILFAIGAHKALLPFVPGASDLEGVVDCFTLLDQIHRGKRAEAIESIVIIGGDRASVDLARSIKSAGCEHVTIIYPRSREEMPVGEHQIQAAEEEGVRIYFHTDPARIVGKNGRAEGIECIRKEPASSIIRRKKTVPVSDSNFIIKADTVTSTLNREPEISLFQEETGFKVSMLNTVSVDPQSLSVNGEGIFAAGDCVTGPKSVIEAIASGRRAAGSIDAFLTGRSQQGPFKESEPIEYEVKGEHNRNSEQVRMLQLPVSERNALSEVDLGYTNQQAIEEARRCLKCGPCMECDICNTDCEKRLVMLLQPGDEAGSLLRVNGNVFSTNGRRLEGQLTWNGKDSLGVEIERISASVNRDLCRGCGDCTEVCLYSAPRLIDYGNGLFISQIDESQCRGCGVCPSICPSSAIGISYFSDSQLNRASESVLLEKKIVAFICNWSHNLTTDLEEIADLLLIRVPCSARINSTHIINAFNQGAQGVLGIGCYEKACHYSAVSETAEHFQIAKKVTQTLGLEPQRIRFERLSPDHPDRIRSLIRSFVKKIEGYQS